MMKRSLPILVAVALVVVVAWLWLARDRRSEPAPSAGAADTAPSIAPSPTSPPRPTPTPTPTSGPRGAPPMLPSSDATPHTPRTFKRELLEQLEAIDPAFRACIAAAALDGDGAVRLRFIIANGDAGVVVELAEIDHDQTTLAGDALHACIAAAPREMKFAPIRPDVDAISVSFDVTVVAGEYAGTGGRDFAFLRDTDSPTE